LPAQGRLHIAGPLPSMRRNKTILAVGVIIIFLGVVAALALRFDLSALPEPGRMEVALATRAKRILIARASRQNIPPQPQSTPDGVTEGKTRYGVECAACHGMDGRGLTDNGRWMYPRAADLTSPAVQEYSDQQLFWIVKNGVRLSGMPAFGKLESDERIWRIVQYLRTMPPKPGPARAQR
jgi:mono/diheme cytochrome c family protein